MARQGEGDLIRQTGFVFAYIPESSPGRSDASGCRKQPNDQHPVGENPESAL